MNSHRIYRKDKKKSKRKKMIRNKLSHLLKLGDVR